MIRHLLCVVMLALVGGTAALAESTAERPRNVLLLIADDLSANALSCYGNRQCRTPSIDRLASVGVRFDRAYSQYPVCAASRAAIMSGMYPQAIGVTGNGAAGRFTENLGARPSYSQWFIQHNYYAARVGKIFHMRVPGDITAGVDGPDHAASWTERFNCQGPEWMSRGLHRQLSNEQLNRDPHAHYGLGFGGSFYVVKTKTDGREQPDVQAATRAIQLLRKHRDGRFFLAVGFVRPHVPLVAPAEYFRPYPSDSMRLPASVKNDLADVPIVGQKGSSQERGIDSTARKQQALAAYYASVAFMDDQVGRILDELDALEMRENTIVIFTSDHGYHLGEHDLWQKMSLHEESVRIPLVISSPGIQPAVTESLVEQVDLFPTTAQLASLPIPPHCQGMSLLPVMKDPQARVREAIYCLRRQNDHLWRTDRWAWIRYGGGESELYDMQRDPQQFTNLAGRSEYHEITVQLDQQLNAKLKELATP